jgi:hypothetical protein
MENKKLRPGDFAELLILERENGRVNGRVYVVILEDVTKYSSWIADERAGIFLVLNPKSMEQFEVQGRELQTADFIGGMKVVRDGWGETNERKGE